MKIEEEKKLIRILNKFFVDKMVLVLRNDINIYSN